MTRRKRRNHSAAFKAKVSLSAVTGERTLAELAGQYDIHPNQIQDWKRSLVEGAGDVFGGNAVEAQNNGHEVGKLHAKVGMKRIGIFFLIVGALISAGCTRTHTHLAGLLRPVTPAVVGDHSHQDSVKFLVFGDSGTGDKNQTKVARGMWQVCAPDGQNNDCDFALVLGDNIYERWCLERGGVSGPGDKKFQKNFEKPYSRFQRFDFWLVPGNHDWEREDSVQEEIKHTLESNRWRMPFNHYSIPGLPEWLHVYGLDTTVIYDADYDNKKTSSADPERAAQLKNAKAQLKAVKAALRDKTGWIFLFGHHPVYSTGKHGIKKGNRGVIPAIKSAIVDELICDAGIDGIDIDVYFAGHEHHQEHLEAPGCLGCGGDAAFHQVVQGAGGKLRNPKKKVNGIATLKKRIVEYGFALVTVSKTRLAVDFYAYDEQHRSWGKRYGFKEFRRSGWPRSEL